MRLLKAHILDDANWNPRRPKKESWNEAGSLELLDRLLATAGSFIFAICFGPQIIIFPVCFSFLHAAQVIENPLRNAWVAYWAIACAQLIIAYLRRSYFYDSYPVYYFFGTLMVVGFLVAATAVKWMSQMKDADSELGSLFQTFHNSALVYAATLLQLFWVWGQ